MTPVALNYKGGQIDINAICSKQIYIIRNEETHTRALLHFARGESKRLGCKKKHRSSWSMSEQIGPSTPRQEENKGDWAGGTKNWTLPATGFSLLPPWSQMSRQNEVPNMSKCLRKTSTTCDKGKQKKSVGITRNKTLSPSVSSVLFLMTPVALNYKGGQIDINAICSKQIYIIRNEETHTRALLHFARGESKRLGCKKKHRSSWSMSEQIGPSTPHA